MPKLKRAQRDRLLKVIKPEQPVEPARRPPSAIPGAAMRVRATCPMCGLRAIVFQDEKRSHLPNLRYPLYEVQVFKQWFGGVKGSEGPHNRGVIVYEEVPEAKVPLMKALLVNTEYVGRVLIDSLAEEGVVLPSNLHEAVPLLGDVLDIWREVERLTDK